MVNKDIHLRVEDELLDLIEIERIKNNEEDKQDTIRRIIEEYIENKNSFWIRLKNLFKF